MLAVERVRYIFDRIHRDHTVRVDELARELKVSPMTIRRDLTELEQQGKLQRTYGGAILAGVLNREQRYDEKAVQAHDAKVAIAEACLELIPNGATVIIDAGTTTFEVARLLGRRTDITAVTIDLAIATELVRQNVNVYVVGGHVQNSTGSMFGPSAETFLEGMRADCCVIGVAGIAPDGTLLTPTMQKASLKRRMIASSGSAILAADAHKFDLSSVWRICGLGAFDHVVTDAEISNGALERYRIDRSVVVTAGNRYHEGGATHIS